MCQSEKEIVPIWYFINRFTTIAEAVIFIYFKNSYDIQQFDPIEGLP